MSNNIMVDLETMGTAADSAIVAIGAVRFHQGAIAGKFYAAVNLQSSIDAGLKLDGDTVMWWLSQSQEARDALLCPAGKLHLTLTDFGNWINESPNPVIWGNGASFDNSILATAYEKCQLDLPWMFWNDRCYRTVKNLYPQVKLSRVGTYHNAVNDAESQALHLITIAKVAGWEL